MNTFQIIIAVINLIAVIIAPIAAVFIGQLLQDRTEKRKDKKRVFQLLMTRRAVGWTSYDCVDALNSIDIVFSDCKQVCEQWQRLHDLYNKPMNTVSTQEYSREQCRLLEKMANSLGYKDRITWDNIQNPYIPTGLLNQMKNQEDYQNRQVQIMDMFLDSFEKQSKSDSLKND